MPLTASPSSSPLMEATWAFTTQPTPTKMPPSATIGLGPNLSANQPLNGTTHVSKSTKSVNAD